MKKTLIQILILLPQLGFSTVDLKTGSFSETAIDFIHDSFRLERKYQSRSLFNGLFGFGWCSNLDIQLKVLSKNEVVLQDCTGDQVYRGDSPSPVLKSQKDSIEKVAKGNLYRRTLPDNTIQIFSERGRLLKWGKLEFHYSEEGHLQSLRIQEGPLLTFAMANKKIAQVNIAGKSLVYSYDNNNLKEAGNFWNQRTFYRYDEFHNLLRIDYSNAQFVSLYYESQSDRLIRQVGRDGCTDHFDYTLMPDNPKAHYVTKWKRSCAGTLIRDLTYDFQFKKTVAGRSYLAELRIFAARSPASEGTTYQFDELGRLSWVKKNGFVFQPLYLGRTNEVTGFRSPQLGPITQLELIRVIKESLDVFKSNEQISL